MDRAPLSGRDDSSVGDSTVGTGVPRWGWQHSPTPKKFRDRPRALAYAPLMRCPVTCPNCDKPALRLLEHWSIRTSLDYWCCDMCGHVTAATKDLTDVAGQLPKPKPLPAPPFVPVTSDRRRAS